MFSNYFNFKLEDFFGIFTGIGIFLVLMIIGIIVVSIVAKWRLFKKAGKNGWEAIVPFYSDYVLVQIAGLNWWWYFFLIIDFTFTFNNSNISFDIIGFIGRLNCYYNIAKRFGKNKNTSLLAGIFSYIFMLIFGLSNNEVYDENILVDPNGLFGNNNNFEENSKSTKDVDIQKEKVSKSTTSVDSEVCYCGECGEKLNNKMKFCPKCGHKNKKSN